MGILRGEPVNTQEAGDMTERMRPACYDLHDAEVTYVKLAAPYLPDISLLQAGYTPKVGSTGALAISVLDERERCAKIVESASFEAVGCESTNSDYWDCTLDAAATRAAWAAKIRSGK